MILYISKHVLFCFDPSKGGLSAAEFAAKNYLTTLVSILEQDEPHALKLVKYDLQPWTVSIFSCWMLLSNQIFKT